MNVKNRLRNSKGQFISNKSADAIKNAARQVGVFGDKDEIQKYYLQNEREINNILFSFSAAAPDQNKFFDNGNVFIDNVIKSVKNSSKVFTNDNGDINPIGKNEAIKTLYEFKQFMLSNFNSPAQLLPVQINAAGQVIVPDLKNALYYIQEENIDIEDIEDYLENNYDIDTIIS